MELSVHGERSADYRQIEVPGGRHSLENLRILEVNMPKKIIEVFVPVFDSILDDGTVICETYEAAKQALTETLLAECPGSNGQIEKFFVCVEEESPILLPPGHGGLHIVKS
jgi:hypothetical protein